MSQQSQSKKQLLLCTKFGLTDFSSDRDKSFAYKEAVVIMSDSNNFHYNTTIIIIETEMDAHDVSFSIPTWRRQ